MEMPELRLVLRQLHSNDLDNLIQEINDIKKERLYGESYVETQRLQKLPNDKGGAALELSKIRDGLDISGIPSFEGTKYAVDGDTTARVWYVLLPDQKDKDEMIKAINELKNNEPPTELKL